MLVRATLFSLFVALLRAFWLIHHMNQHDAGRCPMGINVIGHVMGHFAKPPDNAGQYFIENVDLP
jgi:hypothetical protein